MVGVRGPWLVGVRGPWLVGVRGPWLVGDRRPWLVGVRSPWLVGVRGPWLVSSLLHPSGFHPPSSSIHDRLCGTPFFLPSMFSGMMILVTGMMVGIYHYGV